MYLLLLIHTSTYQKKKDHDLQTKFASLARKVEALELKKSSQLKSVKEIVCQIYETNEHSTNDCPTLPFFRECLHEQAHALNSFQRTNHNPYSQKYNPGWRNHSNFSWKSGNNNAQTSSHHFKHNIIFKILMDMHLLIFPLLEEILRKHCMHSLKARDNQHSKCSNHGRYKRYSCKVHIYS